MIPANYKKMKKIEIRVLLSDSSGFEVFVHSPIHAITGQTVQLYCNFSLPHGLTLMLILMLILMLVLILNENCDGGDDDDSGSVYESDVNIEDSNDIDNGVGFNQC